MKSKTIIVSPSFPPEIILEILLKLPVESLLRCKSVCKEWCSLISDQDFIKSHYNYSLSASTNNINYQYHRLVFNTFDPTNTVCLSKKKMTNNFFSCPLYDILFDGSVKNALLLENPFQRTPSRDIRIVGSCNGLMCLFVQDDDHNYDLFIYNPSTRICSGSLFRCRSNELELYSFGYDESTHDYKIVQLSITKKVKIYSLNTGTWKNIGDLNFPRPIYGFAKFLNGALHWVAYDDSPAPRIVSLDLANETFGEVLQPVSDKGRINLSLGVLGEWLCVISDYGGNHVDVWVMKDYGVKDSWTKLASFSYQTNGGWVDPFIVPLFISNDGKVLFKCIMGLVIYDSKDSSVSRIQDFKFDEACIVVEGLVSPFPPLGLADNNDDEN